MKKLFLCVALLLVLQGCNNMNIQNPFETGPATTETYYDQFDDVPIPGDMTIDRNRTLITTAPDGTRLGLMTLEGRVEINSLAQATMNNMTSQGWTLTGRTVGVKQVQVYEKDQRVAVIYFYQQTINTAMEVWMAARQSSFMGSSPRSTGTLPTRGNVNATKLSQ